MGESRANLSSQKLVPIPISLIFSAGATNPWLCLLPCEWREALFCIHGNPTGKSLYLGFIEGQPSVKGFKDLNKPHS